MEVTQLFGLLGVELHATGLHPLGFKRLTLSLSAVAVAVDLVTAVAVEQEVWFMQRVSQLTQPKRQQSPLEEVERARWPLLRLILVPLEQVVARPKYLLAQMD
jgi:hypothetical protein